MRSPFLLNSEPRGSSVLRLRCERNAERKSAAWDGRGEDAAAHDAQLEDGARSLRCVLTGSSGLFGIVYCFCVYAKRILQTPILNMDFFLCTQNYMIIM